MKHIAIIGAGWAGAAAAWRLHQLGHQATVFEAAKTVGGRARLHRSTKLGQTVDNGQHILLGAYRSTLQLMQELGLDPDTAFYRFDLDIHSADESFRFKTAPLPAPLHLLGPLFNAKGLLIAERLQLLRLHRYLIKRRWHVPSGMTVHELLHLTKQPNVLVQKLWTPLCIAALNTPIQQACAQLFAAVLRDSLGAKRADTQMLIPLQNMSDLWSVAALQHAELRLGQTVRQLTLTTTGKYRINEENTAYDGVILATNAPSATRLLAPLGYDLPHFDYNPIATLYLQPEAAWDCPYPMLMLEEDSHGLAAGQWLFNHAALPGSEFGKIISVSISYANRLQDHSKEAITQAILQQIQQQVRTPLPTIVASELITEKRATFVASPELQRPPLHTPFPEVKLAGDWVHNEYPAVLEGAVRSGLAAADAFA